MSMSGGSIEVHRPDTCRLLHLLGQNEGEDGLDLNAVRPSSRVVMVYMP